MNTTKHNLLVGLTGGICCGKSTVIKTFERHNIPSVDADIVAREVVEPGTFGLEQIVSSFGGTILLPNGFLDRIKLGEIVFNSTVEMKKLNMIMAPLIESESKKQICLLQKEHAIIVYNAALICEKGHAKDYNPLIVVSCPKEMQIERLMKRNSLTLEQAEARINAQMPLEDKIKLADHIIDTSGTIESSILQTEFIVSRLKESVYAL